VAENLSRGRLKSYAGWGGAEKRSGKKSETWGGTNAGMGGLQRFALRCGYATGGRQKKDGPLKRTGKKKGERIAGTLRALKSPTLKLPEKPLNPKEGEKRKRKKKDSYELQPLAIRKRGLVGEIPIFKILLGIIRLRGSKKKTPTKHKQPLGKETKKTKGEIRIGLLRSLHNSCRKRKTWGVRKIRPIQSTGRGTKSNQ